MRIILEKKILLFILVAFCVSCGSPPWTVPWAEPWNITVYIYIKILDSEVEWPDNQGFTYNTLSVSIDDLELPSGTDFIVNVLIHEGEEYATFVIDYTEKNLDTGLTTILSEEITLHLNDTTEAYVIFWGNRMISFDSLSQMNDYLLINGFSPFNTNIYSSM